MEYPFYKVGGCVRDEFLGITSKDIDYAVEAPSFNDMRAAILTRGGKIFLETPEHFTIRANVPNLGACDYVLCRKEGPYSDGRRPDWVTVGTLADDLARRDFRMNAIAIAEDGTVIDPHGGRGDIQIKLIRCVGDPLERFKEDKLRVFRAIRFAVEKKFDIDAQTAWAMKKVIRIGNEAFDGVSTPRIVVELGKACRADSIQTFAWIHDFGLHHIIRAREIRFEPTIKKA
jgi:tRNA nucleotidyltransferase (CCA-adding enzyme)